MVRFEMRISFTHKNEHGGPPSLTPALLRKQGPRCRSKTVQMLAAPQKMRQEIPTDPQFGSMQKYTCHSSNLRRRQDLPKTGGSISSTVTHSLQALIDWSHRVKSIKPPELRRIRNSNSVCGQ
jgi:hypothetical protein